MLKAYLMDKWKLFVAFIGGSVILKFIQYLYNYSQEPVNYSLEIIVVIYILYSIWDYRRYKREAGILYKLSKEAYYKAELLEEHADFMKRAYRTLCEALEQKNKRLISEKDAKQTEMMDYYTMWVHQIKTPLSALHLVLETEDAEVEEIKKIFEQELFKVEQYVEMVLYYLRLDALQEDLSFKQIHLLDLVRECVKKYAVLFIYKKIEMKLEIEEQISVVSDEKWLAFVLEQILSNALKYTPKGSITLGYVEGKGLYIKDTGIGIREEDLPRIFERGFTGYNGRLERKSTGIGLYLCQRVITCLGCKLKVESKVGEGTTFWIELIDQVPEVF